MDYVVEENNEKRYVTNSLNDCYRFIEYYKPIAQDGTRWDIFHKYNLIDTIVC